MWNTDDFMKQIPKGNSHSVPHLSWSVNQEPITSHCPLPDESSDKNFKCNIHWSGNAPKSGSLPIHMFSVLIKYCLLSCSFLPVKVCMRHIDMPCVVQQWSQNWRCLKDFLQVSSHSKFLGLEGNEKCKHSHNMLSTSATTACLINVSPSCFLK